MKSLSAALATLAALLLPVGATATLIPAHSHWDVARYNNHEVKFCYAVQAKKTDNGTPSAIISFLPLREVDSQNFMELDLRQDGFAMRRRVSGTFTTVTPTFKDGLNHAHGVGSDIMVDFTMVGSTYSLYNLNADNSRGALIEQWQDSTYPSGVNISYYTQPRWEGIWEFVHAFPIQGGTGQPHDITNLLQDARNHNKVLSEATFDDPTPANGNATGITASSTFGLPSGSAYHYTVTMSGPAGGKFDFRDPADYSRSSPFFYDHYRLNLSSTPTIQHVKTGATTTTVNGQVGTGGAGTYTIALSGSSITVQKLGTTILSVSGANTSGVRVRVSPASGQKWSWSGSVG